MSSFSLYGIKVYSSGNQWAVQHPDNANTSETFGDTLHESKKEALIEASLLAGWPPENINAPGLPFSPWLGGPLGQKESAYERREELLSKQVMYEGKPISKKALIEQKVREGGTLDIREVPKIKEMSRLQHFRANNDEQRDHEAKRKSAGNKKEYSISWSNANHDALFLTISKTEYDYAAYLIEEAASPTVTELPKRSLTNLYSLWSKLRDVPTREAACGTVEIEEGFLMFFSGEPIEDIWHWFEAQHPRFIVGDVMQGIYHRRQAVDMEGFGKAHCQDAINNIPVTV